MKTNFTKKEHTDSGLALILLAIIAGFWLGNQLAFKVALLVTIVVLVAPVLVFPFTFIWLNVSDLLGKVMSKIILVLVFFTFVWPVALFRKAISKDTLQLTKFKKNSTSVFTERNHTYTPSDFTTPY